MEQKLKEVYFDRWCNTCKNVNKPEHEDPCNECLTNPGNWDSHKPVNYKPREDAIHG